jgi:hypothetical protein
MVARSPAETSRIPGGNTLNRYSSPAPFTPLCLPDVAELASATAAGTLMKADVVRELRTSAVGLFRSGPKLLTKRFVLLGRRRIL